MQSARMNATIVDSVLTLLLGMALVSCGGESGREPAAPTAEAERTSASNGADKVERIDGAFYPDDTPTAFAGRPTSPSCGREGIAEAPDGQFPEEVARDPDARLCLLDAWERGDDAELSTAAQTVEGPILIVLRVLVSGAVERYEYDPLGRGPIVQECTALEADGRLLAPGTAAPTSAPAELDAAGCDRADRI